MKCHVFTTGLCLSRLIEMKSIEVNTVRLNRSLPSFGLKVMSLLSSYI